MWMALLGISEFIHTNWTTFHDVLGYAMGRKKNAKFNFSCRGFNHKNNSIDTAKTPDDHQA